MSLYSVCGYGSVCVIAPEYECGFDSSMLYQEELRHTYYSWLENVVNFIGYLIKL